jgi:hypothetical protein
MDENRNKIKENVDKKKQEIEYQDSSATMWCANTSFGDNRQKHQQTIFMRNFGDQITVIWSLEL